MLSVLFPTFESWSKIDKTSCKALLPLESYSAHLGLFFRGNAQQHSGLLEASQL